jgi:hypothetical protein
MSSLVDARDPVDRDFNTFNTTCKAMIISLQAFVAKGTCRTLHIKMQDDLAYDARFLILADSNRSPLA